MAAKKKVIDFSKQTKIEYKNGGGFVMENRLFLLYFPGYYDGDEIIGIYDDISKLKTSYERMISNPADEHGFQQYDFYLNNPYTELTIEEFNRDNEIFVEVEPELLWAELDKESVYGKGPFFLLVTADEWNHDADEWLGIYVSKKTASEAYDRAVAWWNEEQKRGSASTSQRVAMFEYIAMDDRFREVERKELD